jgi:hypothetical protein
LIGDKGFIKPFLKQELAEHEIDLQTPLRKNMTDTRPNSFLISKILQQTEAKCLGEAR